MKKENLGWVVAAALFGAMAASGFQGTTAKFGTVDMKKVFDQSTYAKEQTDVLRNLGTSRESILRFVNQYKFMRTEDATRFRELTLKANPSAADKDAIEKLTAAVQAEEAKYRALQTKQNPTAEEQKQLADYGQRIQAMGQLQAAWAQEFENEVGDLQSKLREQALERVKTSIADVAKKEGYSMVFVTDIAPYSANDITTQSLQLMNSKK